MATRADTITQTLKKSEIYSDFPNNFIKHPITNELVKLKNEDSVRQAFKNLILTNIGERFFDPFFGSNVSRSLFEPLDTFTIEDIRRYIIHSAQQFETRIQLLDISILDVADQNSIAISVMFSIINNPEPVTLNLFLKRVR